MRCSCTVLSLFSKAPRLGLHHNEIGADNSQLRAAHNWFRALRNRFVAHSVTPLEQVWAAVGYAVAEGVPEPAAINEDEII